ncbi:MAG: sensor histidine kinase [Rhodomicrobiaceae bacterium]
MASIPLGEFLTSEDPVWVWDASTRRILWANNAGRRFWGADTLETLRARRFSPRNKAVLKLAELASASDAAGERIETLTFDGASGRISVRCHLQGLVVAGGKPGLIVKAQGHPQRESRQTAAPSPAGKAPRSVARAPGGRSASDKAALEAIATRMKQGPRKAVNQPAAHAGQLSPEQERLVLSVRELCHEMRNPLSVISGFAERIKDIAPPGKKQDQLRAYADDIMESAGLALAILGDFSTHLLAPGENAPKAEPVDLRTTVESCLRLVAPLAKNAGVKLYRRTGGNLPRLLAAERVIKQILLNLLMNALRYNKTGGQIRVTVRQHKDGAVRLAVIDDGKGMSKKDIRAALSRSRAVPATRPGRSGLGLPLVRRLVDGAGGQLAIESARGKGTTVEIVFPAAA